MASFFAFSILRFNSFLVSVILLSVYEFAAFSVSAALSFNCLTFTASVSVVPAAMLVIWRSLPALPTDTVFSRSATESEPNATLLVADADDLVPSAVLSVPVALLWAPVAVARIPCATEKYPDAVDNSPDAEL